MSNPIENRPSRRPFIGIHFKCCGVYARIYLNKSGTEYAGHCPKCAAPITVKTGPGGRKEKFWVAE